MSTEIKPGDKILITRRATDEEWKGAQETRLDKDSMVGKTLTVGGVYHHAPLLWTRENSPNGNNCHPICICQKVEDEPQAEAATDTITITIPAPPRGWVHEKRKPESEEDYMWFSGASQKWRPENTKDVSDMPGIYAFRQRDEYAERYEALGLPDGWAQRNTDGTVVWASKNVWESSRVSLRRIINGKAYKIGEEPK